MFIPPGIGGTTTKTGANFICLTGFVSRAEQVGIIQRGDFRLLATDGRVMATLRSGIFNLTPFIDQFVTVCGLDEGNIEGVRSILVTNVTSGQGCALPSTPSFDIKTLLLLSLLCGGRSNINPLLSKGGKVGKGGKGGKGGIGVGGLSGLGKLGTSGLGKLGTTGLGKPITSGLGKLGKPTTGKPITSGLGKLGKPTIGKPITSGLGKLGKPGLGKLGTSGLGKLGKQGFGKLGTSGLGKLGTPGLGTFGGFPQSTTGI